MILVGILLGCGLLTIARLPLLATAAAGGAAPAEARPSGSRSPSIAPETTWQEVPAAAAVELGTASARAVHRKSRRKTSGSFCDPPYRYDSFGIKRIVLGCL
jgi:hypothetical protein